MLFRHDPVLVRKDGRALEPPHRTKREVVVRVQVPMTRRGAALAAAGLVTSGLGALFATALVLTTDRGPAPLPYLTPSPSPIEVEYPDYPGAPPLRTVSTAVPSTPVADRVTASIASVTSTANDDPRVPPSPPVVLAAASPFDVRGAAPQLVVASAGDTGAAVRLDDSRPADSPPRRIGPPLALTMLGGIRSNGQLALVLDVTEQGDVARVVSHEAVDVHADVVDSITTAARGWRYEPARREGVAVPARVRVVVQLNGGQ